jgi:SAM-dependent methyltransferase
MMLMLDATASYRAMWFDKDYANCVYIDKRKEVKPTIVCSWNNLPFIDGAFDLVLFDPPHTNPGETGRGIMTNLWGAIRSEKMVPTLYFASRELLRVLKEDGQFILKWNTHSKSLASVLAIFPIKPLFGHKTAFKTKHSSQTYWVFFIKSKTKPELLTGVLESPHLLHVNSQRGC